MSINNDLLIDILKEFENTFTQGISEYKLIKTLQNKPFEFFSSRINDNSLTLFRAHFILFNALYQLQNYWIKNRTGCLDIFTLNICLKPYSENNIDSKKNSSVKDYYLDINNLSSSQEDVDRMLNTFWYSMQNRMAKKITITKQEEQDSIHILGIDKKFEYDLVSLKKQYRKRMLQNHPDKGGSASKAQEIVRAYQLLKFKLYHLQDALK